MTTQTLLPRPDEKSRVRLAAAADTAAATLLGLAADPLVTVRAAVALNPAAPTEVNQKIATDSDPVVRSLLAHRLASLLPPEAMATLIILVRDEAIRVRRAIADAVKDMAHAPRALILRLAQDCAAQVCDPVIRLSPLLTDDNLVALVRAPATPATSIAVARRKRIGEAVTDAIAGSDDISAITAMLENPSAAIREATLDDLIARAKPHNAWHAPLVRRPTLSAAAAEALSEFVADQLVAELAGRADLDGATTAELHHRLRRQLDSTSPPQPTPNPDSDAAMALANKLFAKGSLTEAMALKAAERGDAVGLTAMLAVAADVAFSVVDRAATLRSAKGIVSLAWKAGFTMAAAEAAQGLLAGIQPAEVLVAAPRGGFPLAEEEMRWQIEFLGRMGR
jgi:hypothetical protein